MNFLCKIDLFLDSNFLIVISLLVVFTIVLGGAVILFLNNRELRKELANKNDATFKRLFNNSPIMMHNINIEGEILSVNSSWLKILGYDEEEVIGKKSELFFTGNIRHTYKMKFEELLQNGYLNEFEAEMVKKNGEVIIVLITSEVSYDLNGEPFQSFSIMMDVTKRKRAEREVLESKYKLDSILNNSVEAIFIMQDERIKYANPATTEILGYSQKELFESKFEKIIYHEDKKFVMDNYAKRMRGEEVPTRYSFRTVKRNGEVIWIEINAVFLLWDGKPAILIFLVEITSRKRQEDMMNEQAKTLIEKNELQEKFNEELKRKNIELDEHQRELQDYADELKAVLEEVAVKNQRIEETHQDMMDSIEYARIIQEAVLRISDNINNNYENFVMFMPKDIVSGDFYYYKEKNEYSIFALADCTGHGVPGGFLSMLGVKLLQEVLANSKELKPNIILEDLREKFKVVFKESRHHDGMDIAVCIYDKNNSKLHYAGANLPALLVANGEQIMMKPVYNPIGFFMGEKSFITHSYDIAPNDKIYLYSDGYKDQFGGEKGRKYQSRNFLKFLGEIENHPMDKQKELLLNEHKEWKGSENQLDDITIFGVKLK
jgi:PAS domain S-box-containing protein